MTGIVKKIVSLISLDGKGLLHKMISRRSIQILFILIPALLWQLSLSRECRGAAFAYIPNSGDNNVSIIKVRGNSDQGTVNVGAGPYGVALGNEYLFLSNSSDNTVSVISMSDNSLIGTLDAGDAPRGLAVASDDSYVYVANHSANTLSIIEASDSNRTALDVGAGPIGVAVSPDEDCIYVTNNSDDSLSVISTHPHELFVTLSNHQYIYYYNDPDEDVAFDKPYGVTVSPDGYYIFVVNNGNNTLSILSAYEVYSQGDNFDWADYDPDDDDEGPYGLFQPVALGDDPRCVAVTPDQAYAYVTNYADDTVSVIALANYEVIETIDVGNGPCGISVTGFGDFVYVVNQLAGTVSVIDVYDDDGEFTNTVVETIAVGDMPVAFGDFIGGKTPRPPSNLEATRKGTYGINLTWDDNSDDELGFMIIRKHYINGTYYEIAVLGEDTTTYTEKGLEGNSNYYYKVIAYNYVGYSDYSNEAYATTGDDSSGCFIATAAYGSVLEPHVKILRDFRDRFLATNTPGKTLLGIYYKYSPPIAHYIQSHDMLRIAVRCGLLPVVGISWLVLSIGPASALGVVAICMSLGIIAVRFGKRRGLSGT
jgi:YVTN family beta-propeller protein